MKFVELANLKCSYNRDLLKYSLSFFNLVVKNFFPLKKEGGGRGLIREGGLHRGYSTA